jgi:hypothetical protein
MGKALLGVPAAAFSDITRDRDGRSPHLAGKAESLFLRKLSCHGVDRFHQPHGALPNKQIAKLPCLHAFIPIAEWKFGQDHGGFTLSGSSLTGLEQTGSPPPAS